MMNFEQGENALRNEGVVPPTDAQEALKAHQGELDEISDRAKQSLSAAGGDYEIAIAEATLSGDTKLTEKLQVMQNAEDRKALDS